MLMINNDNEIVIIISVWAANVFIEACRTGIV